MIQIESLLSARLFMSPQRIGERIYFISNLSGKLSLYAMNYGGSVPEPLLPLDIALQNPVLLGGKPFYVFPKLEQIVVMLDQNGDENYQPMIVPMEGGYMMLTLAGRHPELWSAAVDMFGPYDLVTFSERIPPTWKPYFKLAIGDPDDPEDRKLLEEMSPKTYLDELACPMLVIQGGNDPRVVAQESRDLVADLSAKGKDIEILVFEDEGHDVLKYDNRVRCYNAITEFFQQKLMKGSS